MGVPGWGGGTALSGRGVACWVMDMGLEGVMGGAGGVRAALSTLNASLVPPSPLPPPPPPMPSHERAPIIRVVILGVDAPLRSWWTHTRGRVCLGEPQGRGSGGGGGGGGDRTTPPDSTSPSSSSLG